MSDYNKPNNGAIKFKSSSKKKNVKGVIAGLLIAASSCSVLFFLYSKSDNHNTSNHQKNIDTPYSSSEDQLISDTSQEVSLVSTTTSQTVYDSETNISTLEYDTVGTKFQYDGHSYQLFRLYDITGIDVVSFCYNQGGYFAHINNESENQFLASTIGSLGYDIVYFGYSDEQSEGDWYWIDGEYSSFVNWCSGEPNNEAGEEHYALISPDGTWNDGKLERDSRGGAIILCEWNTSFENDEPIQHVSDYKSHISSTTSSSHLANETYGNKTYVYSAEKAFDNDMTTCWSEGVDGYGVGESITVSFDDVYEISELSLWNGLCTSEDLFYKNSRLHNITVTLSNGNSYDFECSGGWDSRHNSFSFGGNIETSSITITIQSVYEGDKYKDTCISEIIVS